MRKAFTAFCLDRNPDERWVRWRMCSDGDWTKVTPYTPGLTSLSARVYQEIEYLEEGGFYRVVIETGRSFEWPVTLMDGTKPHGLLISTERITTSDLWRFPMGA